MLLVECFYKSLFYSLSLHTYLKNIIPFYDEKQRIYIEYYGPFGTM